MQNAVQVSVKQCNQQQITSFIAALCLCLACHLHIFKHHRFDAGWVYRDMVY